MKAEAIGTGLVGAFAIVLAMSCNHNGPGSRKPQYDEITALWTQIRDWRREAGLPVEPSHQDVISIAPMSLKSAKAVCGADHVVPPTCNDVCSLSDAICDNAESICSLADELKDQWSADKCASAKASCRDAKKNCCSCSEPPKAPIQ